MQIPNGYDEIKQVYGDPKFRDLGDGHLAVDPAWESANCVLIDVPGYDRKLYVHRLIADALCRALTAAIARRPDYKIRTLGCFNPRCKRKIVFDANGNHHVTFRTDRPSLHGWAIAVDLNADMNPYGSVAYDMPQEFIEEFAAHGFIWGGTFTTPDAMHFQHAKGA